VRALSDIHDEFIFKLYRRGLIPVKA
jgi:hypothetical protein